MTDDSDVGVVLGIANQIMAAAGCASLITIDESGLPFSRPVRTFPSDEQFSRITVPSDVHSRKTHQAKNNPNVVLSYVDAPSRGYVTIIGKAVLDDSPKGKQAAWLEPFAAFWPDGPDSEDYLLIVVTPERIETRSYTQGVAESPTRWTPITLARTDSGGWQLAG
jgi:general stress protein 26